MWTKTWRTALLFVLCCILGSYSSLYAQNPIPQKTEFLVNDYAGLLNRNEVVSLGEKLRAYEDSTSTQIAIITEESLNGDDLFDRVQRIADSWGVGGKANDNGIIIYVAETDRKIRIHTGYGVEHFLPDAIANRIIDNILTPAFREGQYYAGLDRAVDAIIQLSSGEYTDTGSNGGKRGTSGFSRILFFIILMVFILAFFNRRGGDDDDDDDGGYWRGGRYERHPRRRGGGWVFFPPIGGGFGGGGGGGGGGGFGGFGGGGFGGFGGGGFGGGGASGGW